MFTIKFADGQQVTGLEFCGGYSFGRVEEIPTELFTPSRMRNITIESDDPEEDGQYMTGTHSLMRFAGITDDKVNGRWLVCLDEPDPEVMRQEKLQADIEYLALMTGVEL